MWDVPPFRNINEDVARDSTGDTSFSRLIKSRANWSFDKTARLIEQLEIERRKILTADP